MIKRGIPIYSSTETFQALKLPSKYNYFCNPIEHNKQFQIDSFKIVPFDLPHYNNDSSPCKNFGFLIYSTVTKEKLLFATDCGYISQTFPPCETYMLEVNYIDDVEDYKAEMEFIEAHTERRRFISHLSYTNCLKFLQSQDLSQCKDIYILHVSKDKVPNKQVIVDMLRKDLQLENVKIYV